MGVNTYNNVARAAGIQGKVEIECEIDGNGSVVRTKVLSGHPLLAGTAQENLVQWKFTNSIEVREATFVYEFQLGEPTRDRPRVDFVFDYPNHITVTADGMCVDHIPCNKSELRDYENSSKRSGQSKKGGQP
ncbi:MAG: energy transducer TonB [Acidobacteriota bacterium]